MRRWSAEVRGVAPSWTARFSWQGQPPCWAPSTVALRGGCARSSCVDGPLCHLPARRRCAGVCMCMMEGALLIPARCAGCAACRQESRRRVSTRGCRGRHAIRWCELACAMVLLSLTLLQVWPVRFPCCARRCRASWLGCPRRTAKLRDSHWTIARLSIWAARPPLRWPVHPSRRRLRRQWRCPLRLR